MADLEYMATGIQDEGETKKIDCGVSGWRMGKPLEEVSSVSLRDVATEMTPMASQGHHRGSLLQLEPPLRC